VNGDYQMEVSISAIPTIIEGAFVPCSPEDRTRIRYAFRDAESSSWTSGFLREFEFDPNARVEDPSIAPGPGATEFFIVSKTGDSIFATTFDAATGASTPWEKIFPPPQGATFPVDKPWIVRAGASTYHVAFMEGLSNPKIRLLTTLDGGSSWIGGPVTVAGVSQGSGFCPQPALHSASQTLFLTARFGADLRILRRIGGATSSAYEELLKPGGSPILTRIELYDLSVFSGPNCLPMPHPANTGSCMEADFMHSGTMPYLTDDPTSSTRLYLAHNDRGHAAGIPGESTDPSDVDVVLKRIERVSTSPERWDVTSTVRVPHCGPPSGCSTCTYVSGDPCAHPDAPQGPSARYPDQFCPAIVVDRFGRIHMVFYSNALTCGISEIGQTYDAYYALSSDQAATFSIHNLRTCAQRPALDFDFAPGELRPDYSPREYIGIALNDAAADFTYVTVTYSGTAHGANTTIDRSVIFGHTIRVTNP